MKHRESAKQKESANSAKPEPRDHSRLDLFATDSLEQNMA